MGGASTKNSCPVAAQSRGAAAPRARRERVGRSAADPEAGLPTRHRCDGGGRMPLRTATRAARDGLAAGMASWAADAMEQALALWRGDALSDAEPIGWTAAEAARLEDLRLAARMDRCEVLTCLGRPGEALGEVERLLAADPTRERLVGLRMLALAGSGRPTEALNVYQRLRVRLAEELGVDPSPELADLHTALLRGAAPGELRAPGTVLGRHSLAATGRNSVAATPPRPAQLPAPVGTSPAASPSWVS